MIETDQIVWIFRFQFMQISGDNVESQLSTLIRADSSLYLDIPGVSCCQKLLCFGKPVGEGETERDEGDRNLRLVEISLGTEDFEIDI